MKLISLDPAAGTAGVCCLEIKKGQIDIIWTFAIQSIDSWNVDMQNVFVAHTFASIVMVEQPDYLVSEKPWGLGFSKESLSQLIGMLKSYHLNKIKWQTITNARKTVLGTGSADKAESAKGLLQYPWTKKAKRKIETLIETAQATGKYDELDALLHGLAFCISSNFIQKGDV